jgi:enoyl-CoA hydratase
MSLQLAHGVTRFWSAIVGSAILRGGANRTPARIIMADETVHVATEQHAKGGQVGRVVIANERRLNCLNTPQIIRLIEAFVALAENMELRAVVLTGAGERAFISGADLNELGALCAESSRLYITRLHRLCEAIRACPVPVIARINGVCLGAGLEVAASCDMRVAVDSAVFGMPEVRMGMPSVIEAALLPGLIGWGKTREILMTGEGLMAEEALRIGLVERVVAAARFDQAVDKWLNEICESAPQAVRAQKALINHWQRVSLGEGIMTGIEALSDAYTTGEPQARIAAFFSRKRKRDS